MTLVTWPLQKIAQVAYRHRTTGGWFPACSLCILLTVGNANFISTSPAKQSNLPLPFFWQLRHVRERREDPRWDEVRCCSGQMVKTTPNLGAWGLHTRLGKTKSTAVGEILKAHWEGLDIWIPQAHDPWARFSEDWMSDSHLVWLDHQHQLGQSGQNAKNHLADSGWKGTVVVTWTLEWNRPEYKT